MNRLFSTIFILTIANFLLTNHQAMAQSKIIGEEVTYTSSDGVVLKGYVAFDASSKEKRPAIIVVPEWWGCGDYVRMRARKLAELGYIAMAADYYGAGKIAADPKEATALSGPFYANTEMANSRLEAAIAKIKTYGQTNPEKIAAIGYCFGGSMVLNAAKSGIDLKAVVSFHGGLKGIPAIKGKVKSAILVCHGGADKFISADDINIFKSNLDEAQAPYTFLVYENSTHAFTNPAATENGKKFGLPIAYNEAADKKSWADMKAFLETTFK